MANITWITECPDPPRWQGRIFSKVSINESGCWVWQGSLDRNGYGRFKATIAGSARSFSAHRAAYLALVGPIEYGLVPDHLCRNRACVNPAHMEIVSISVNTKRGDHSGKKGRCGRRAGVLVGCGVHGMDSGYTHKAPNGRTRWVCRPCAVERRTRWLKNVRAA